MWVRLLLFYLQIQNVVHMNENGDTNEDQRFSKFIGVITGLLESSPKGNFSVYIIELTHPHI